MYYVWWHCTVPTSISINSIVKFYHPLYSKPALHICRLQAHLVFRFGGIERVKPSCKSGITSDVTERITHLAYPDRIVPQAASMPWRLPRPASSSSSSSRHSTTATSTTFCSPFTRTAHTFNPLTGWRPLRPPFSRYVVSQPLWAGTNCNPRCCCRSRRCCCFCCCIAPPSTSSTALCRRCCCRSRRCEPTCHAAVPYYLSCRSPTRRHLMRRRLFVFRAFQERNTGSLTTMHVIVIRLPSYSTIFFRSSYRIRFSSGRFKRTINLSGRFSKI